MFIGVSDEHESRETRNTPITFSPFACSLGLPASSSGCPSSRPAAGSSAHSALQRTDGKANAARANPLSPSKHHTLRLQATDSVDRSQRCSARPISYLFASMQFNTVASEESFSSTRGVSREGIGKHQLRVQPTQCPSCHDCRSWKRSPANPISAGSKSCCRYASSRLFSSQICRRYPDPPPLAR